METRQQLSDTQTKSFGGGYWRVPVIYINPIRENVHHNIHKNTVHFWKSDVLSGVISTNHIRKFLDNLGVSVIKKI